MRGNMNGIICQDTSIFPTKKSILIHQTKKKQIKLPIEKPQSGIQATSQYTVAIVWQRNAVHWMAQLVNKFSIIAKQFELIKKILDKEIKFA